MISDQLSLALTLDDSALFSNYIIAQENKLAVAALKSLAEPDRGRVEDFIYLWGEGSPGLTHLLQALCHELAEAERTALYLPVAELIQLSPEILEGVEKYAVVCLDGIDKIAGEPAWETALFTAFNRLRAEGSELVIAAKKAPSALPWGLLDLGSRMRSGLTLRLNQLGDRDKRALLQQRALARGVQLDGAVADFIMLRAPRDTPALLALFDRLDKASLKTKRPITIPFVKQILDW